ncbi:MAG: glycosyltransferase family 4 protein [Pedobacter sp.]|nr:MAG: glycosyltransferase family 4 protein [Pedobacter sp.]
MTIVHFLSLTALLFASMLVYFRVANHYNIIDKPNERSSHQQITIRGGGIIYLVAALFAVFLDNELWLPILGVFIIGTISFVDDRITLSSKIRLFFHLISVSMLFASLQLFTNFPWWVIASLYVIVIGIINAYNFMDGINGITGLYSLVILMGLQYVNVYQTAFIDQDMIWLPVIASLVFLFFNFRKRAKCFAGDVGSVTIAFWIIWLLLSLMLKTENYIYILFLAVYGVDSIFTIIHRLKLKQNIFEAHRLHFYQILANERGVPHLAVSTLYAAIQLAIILLITFSSLAWYWIFLLSVGPLALIYVLLKPSLMKSR